MTNASQKLTMSKKKVYPWTRKRKNSSNVKMTLKKYFNDVKVLSMETPALAKYDVLIAVLVRIDRKINTSKYTLVTTK